MTILISKLQEVKDFHDEFHDENATDLFHSPFFYLPRSVGSARPTTVIFKKYSHFSPLCMLLFRNIGIHSRDHIQGQDAGEDHTTDNGNTHRHAALRS